MYLVGQKVVNGNEIPYQIKGKGPLLVMIHGGGLDRKMWTPQVKALSKKFRVLTYDIRGHGAYDLKDNSGYEIDDLKGILDALKPDKIYLVGHSLGSMLATDFEDHLSKIQLIKQSGLLIYGELDFQYIKDNATKLKQELPDVRIQAIEGAAHFA